MGLQVIRVISGDNELTALDFQKHYRMSVIHLMDPDVTFDRKHNKNGWPFLMLVDPEGQIIYKCTNLVDREKELMRLLEKMKGESFHAATKTVDGLVYMEATLQRSGEDKQLLQNDRFASIAAGQDGKIYTVFTSIKNGNSDIIMRINDGNSPGEDIPIAATNADEYDGTVLVDNKNQVWICWTSNAVDNKYQIHLTSLKDVGDGHKSLVVSKSKEDSMHGRMIENSGTLWITYYQWHNMGTISRDKEVYLRKFSNGILSKEIRISPIDVPNYEDHTDPSISILNQQVFVSWSWDFHKPKGYTQNAENPTIFIRTIAQNLALGKTFNISGHEIDAAPILSKVFNNNLWCAWDSLIYIKEQNVLHKTLYIRAVNNTDALDKKIAIAEDLVNVCSPCFAFYRDQKGVLTWSQTQNGCDWSLWKAEYNSENNRWTRPVQLTSEGNPRFGSCVYDSKGRLWTAYSVKTEKGREIVVTCPELSNGKD